MGFLLANGRLWWRILQSKGSVDLGSKLGPPISLTVMVGKLMRLSEVIASPIKFVHRFLEGFLWQYDCRWNSLSKAPYRYYLWFTHNSPEEPNQEVNSTEMVDPVINRRLRLNVTFPARTCHILGLRAGGSLHCTTYTVLERRWTFTGWETRVMSTTFLSF